MMALALAATIAHLGSSIAQLAGAPSQALSAITALSLAAASAAPRLLAPLAASGEGLALMLMQVGGLRGEGGEGSTQHRRRARSWHHNSQAPACSSMFPLLQLLCHVPCAMLHALLLQVFFAAVGSSADIRLVLATAPVLFAWSALALGAHLGLLLGLGRLAGFSRKELLLASNANIGGEGGPGGQGEAGSTGSTGMVAVAGTRYIHRDHNCVIIMLCA